MLRTIENVAEDSMMGYLMGEIKAQFIHMEVKVCRSCSMFFVNKNVERSFICQEFFDPFFKMHTAPFDFQNAQINNNNNNKLFFIAKKLLDTYKFCTF